MTQGRISDDDWSLLTDALFLRNHPGWTWQALQDTPDDVVDLIRRMDSVTVKREG